MTALVYQATNLVNGKRYIGFTARSLLARERAHRTTARQGQGHRFHAAIRKYGQENFVFEVMADFDDDEELAKLYECEAIAKYKPEYNLTYGGEGGTLAEESRKKIGDANRGRKWSIEAKLRASEIHRGRKHTAETRHKIAEATKGRPSPNKGVSPSIETRQKISAANKGQVPWTTGKKHGAATREKMSAWQRGRLLPDTHRQSISEARKEAWKNNREVYLTAVRAAAKIGQEARKIRVRCVDDGLVFAGCSDADRHYGFRIGTVSRIVKGTIKNRTGMMFERIEREE